MHPFQPFDSLDLDNHLAFHKEIDPVAAIEPSFAIGNGNRNLTFHSETAVVQLVRKARRFRSKTP